MNKKHEARSKKQERKTVTHLENLRLASQKKVVTVFGNEVDDHDSLAIKLVPELEQRVPKIVFRLSDPTESLEPTGDPWVIMDVGVGIDEVMVIEDLRELDYVKGTSVHDYDVYMDLRLMEKLGKLPQMKIILVPHDMEFVLALSKVENEISQI